MNISLIKNRTHKIQLLNSDTNLGGRIPKPVEDIETEEQTEEKIEKTLKKKKPELKKAKETKEKIKPERVKPEKKSITKQTGTSSEQPEEK